LQKAFEVVRHKLGLTSIVKRNSIVSSKSRRGQMKRGVLFAITIGLLTLVTSCSKTTEYSALDPSIVEKELRAMEIGHRTAVDAKDIDGILRYYSSDLITISPGEIGRAHV
jgi:hypothetical protein